MNADGSIKTDYKAYASNDAPFTPVEGDYTVTNFNNDPAVVRAYENVTDYLASKRGIGSALVDPANIGRQDDIAESMRDDEFRIGSKLVKANLLKDSPESIKADMRLLQERWEKAEVTGLGETVSMIRDYGADAIFNPETIGTIAAALFSRGSSLPADIAKRKAGHAAFKKAIEASKSAITTNPLKSTAIIGATYGAVDDLSMQQLELSIDKKTERDFVQTGLATGIGAVAGAGIYGATRLGAKYFSKGTEIADEVPPSSDLFDEADLPESASKLVDDVDNLVLSPGLIYQEGIYNPAGVERRLQDAKAPADPDSSENLTVDPSSVYRAGIYNTQQIPDLLKQVDNLEIDELVEELGGGEKTKAEIKDAIRLAISQETTAAGVKNKTKQAVYKTYSDLSGNWFGKAAGILSPYKDFSATARVLQAKLSHEFGTGVTDYSTKVVEKDLGEVQRQVTGGFSDQFRAIVEDISLNSAKGTLAQDINDMLMLALRSNKEIKFNNIDPQTALNINKAATRIRKLYREMGTSLKDIGVIDDLVDNYIPRMWDRKAIEANPERLAKLLEEKGGYEPGTGMQTVQDMLDIKDQVDAGGAGGHFFSAKRKLNEIENDADFQEFLNDDVLGSLNMYTFQAGKSIAKHRVLGVNNLAQFQKLWTQRIEAELREKGQKLTADDKKQIDLLYKTATSEGLERYGKGTQNAVDAYGFVNRVALLGFATLSSLTEIFINMGKAGVVNSVKGFGEALEVSYKGITKDLTTQLQTKHGLTAKEAFSELRKYSLAMDQAMAQQGNRLAGDDLMNETLQNASNKFFRITLLDQWTKFVQTTAYASGKNLINENIQALAANGGNLSTKRLKTFAGELRELGIDPDEAIEWFNKGAKKDDFYNDSILGGAARYTNSVILQPTAMSGLKPLLHSNPKTAIAFQLLGYPVAFTNTVLKNAAQAMFKDPARNAPKLLGAGLIMTEMARWTNYVRSDGKSEDGKSWGEIYGAAITRWGGNGILLDSFQRARESSMYTKNSAPYLMLPFGPIGSDALSFYQQGIIPTVGKKVPFISGSYMGQQILGDYPVHDYKEALKQAQKEYIRDPLVKEQPDESYKGYGTSFNKGGEVVVPNAPAEPDERIDKMTGQPYNQQAGSAFMDETDPLKVMMNQGGRAPRQRYMAGGVAKATQKLLSPLAEKISNKVDGLFNDETINTAASNIEKQLLDSTANTDSPNFEIYLDAVIDDNLEPDNFRSLEELKQIPEWRKAIENQDETKQDQLWAEAQKALGIPERKLSALKTIQRLQKEVDPVGGLESVITNSLGKLSSEYRRVRPDPKTMMWEELPDNARTRLLKNKFKRYIVQNTKGLSEEGIETLSHQNAIRVLSSDDPDLYQFDFITTLEEGTGDLQLDRLITADKDIQKILKKSNLVDEAIEYSDNNYGTLSQELERLTKKAIFQEKAAKALEDAGYNPTRLDRWGYGAEMEKDGVTFSERNPIGFYSLAEKVAKETSLGEGGKPKSYEQFLKALKKGGVKQEELEWTGFIEEFKGRKDLTRNEVTKFFRDNRLDVEEEIYDDQDVNAFSRFTYANKFDDSSIDISPEMERLEDMYAILNDDVNDFRTTVDNLDEIPVNERTREDAEDLTEARENLEYFSEELRDTYEKIIKLQNLGKAHPLINYRSVVLKFPDSKATTDPYINPEHFGEVKNPLVHIRLSDIKGKDVEDGLLIEEIQSDVHMQGEKRGYTKDYSNTDYQTEDARILTRMNELEREREMYEDTILELEDELELELVDIDFEVLDRTSDIMERRPDLQEATEAIELINLELTELSEELSDPFDEQILRAVPEMPFKSQRQGGGWRQLGIRRVLIEAARKDYSDIVLPTGREQLSRYNMKPEEKRSQAMLRNYDDHFVGLLNRFGKKYNVEVKESQLDPDGLLRRFQVTDEMKADILRGLPQFYAGGLINKRKAYSEGGLYKILTGDTLSKIARDNNTTVGELAKLNKLSNPDLIYAGDELILPTTAKEEQVAEPVDVPLREQVESVYSRAKDSMSDAANVVSAKASGLTEQVGQALSSYKAPDQPDRYLKPPTEAPPASDQTVSMPDTLAQTQDALINFGQGAKDAVASGASAIAKNVTGVASDLSTQTDEVLQDTAQAVTAFRDQTQTSMDNIQQQRQRDTARQQEAIDKSLSNVSDTVRAVSDRASETFDSVTESAGKGITALKNLLGSYEAPERRQPRLAPDREAPKSPEINLEKLKEFGSTAIGKLKEAFIPDTSNVQIPKAEINLLPENALAFARFYIGNALGLTEGTDVRVENFGRQQQNVLKQAMINASNAGRDYIKYDDYPEMKTGEKPYDFYRAKRADRSLIDIVKESMTDPVFEMFTTTGVFNFTRNNDGTFNILPDRYDFNASKNRKERKAKDAYSELVYGAQDVDNQYAFNITGTI